MDEHRGGFLCRDLRDEFSETACAAFVDLYLATFVDPAERESPASWPQRLTSLLPPPQPEFHLLVAEEVPGGAVIGGLVFEIYQRSRSALLTYMAVRRDWRRCGVARALIGATRARLDSERAGPGGCVRGVFAEAEDPDRVPPGYGPMDPRARLLVLASLGARRVDIQYVQPQLEGGSGKARHLFLLTFAPGQTLDGGVVRDFLHEFHRALGIRRPEEDPDFRSMSAELEGPVPVRDLIPSGGSSVR